MEMSFFPTSVIFSVAMLVSWISCCSYSSTSLAFLVANSCKLQSLYPPPFFVLLTLLCKDIVWCICTGIWLSSQLRNQHPKPGSPSISKDPMLYIITSIHIHVYIDIKYLGIWIDISYTFLYLFRLSRDFPISMVHHLTLTNIELWVHQTHAGYWSNHPPTLGSMVKVCKSEKAPGAIHYTNVI